MSVEVAAALFLIIQCEHAEPERLNLFSGHQGVDVRGRALRRLLAALADLLSHLRHLRGNQQVRNQLTSLSPMKTPAKIAEKSKYRVMENSFLYRQ